MEKDIIKPPYEQKGESLCIDGHTVSLRFASDPAPGVLEDVKRILLNEATKIDKPRQNLQR